MSPSRRNILITGASSGIGEALAKHYAAPGICLALTGRDAARLDAVAEACRGRGAAVEAATIDITDRDKLRAWIERLDEKAPFDLAIANAAIGSGDESEAMAHRVIATNVGGVLNTVFPIAERMQKRGVGQIALVSSLAAFRGIPTTPSYAASKAAVKSLGESWRILWAPKGIRVSVICPGFVATRMTARNKFKMPFLMSAERAAAIIARGLARDKGRIAFPLALTAVMWLMEALPSPLGDGLMRRAASRDR